MKDIFHRSSNQTHRKDILYVHTRSTKQFANKGFRSLEKDMWNSLPKICIMYFQFELEWHCNVQISLLWFPGKHYSLVNVDSPLHQNIFYGSRYFNEEVIIF